MSVSHGFHATLTAKPGMGDEVAQYLLDLFDSEVRSNEDCVVFLIARSATNRDAVYVTEGWTSQEAHSKLVETPESQAILTGLQALLVCEPVYVDAVAVGGKAAF